MLNLSQVASVVGGIRHAAESVRDELRRFAAVSPDPALAAEATAAADELQALLDSTDFPANAADVLAEVQSVFEKFQGPRVHKPVDFVG